MAVAMILYAYSFYCFVRMILTFLTHDVGTMVNRDYYSDRRDAQRGSAIKWFVKSVLAFCIAGFVGYLFM